MKTTLIFCFYFSRKLSLNNLFNLKNEKFLFAELIRHVIIFHLAFSSLYELTFSFVHAYPKASPGSISTYYLSMSTTVWIGANVMGILVYK